MTPFFCILLSLSLGAMRSCFMVLVSLKGTCMPCFLQVFLNFSTNPCMYGTTKKIFLCLLVLVVTLVLRLLVCWVSVGFESLLLLCLCSKLCFSLFKAQVGKRQNYNALLMWSSSFDKYVWLLETTVAMCLGVVYTMFGYNAVVAVPMKVLVRVC